MSIDAYCVKCKQKQPMENPQAGFNARGNAVTTGTCAVCGTKMYRIGKTDLHEGMEKPAVEPKKKQVAKRHGKLVIVESPAKAHTVSRYLGKDYKVKASVGHVRDLLKSELSVDVDNGFTPKYRVPNEKRQLVKELKKEASTAEEVYLATDPDREGEAIAWHLLESIEADPATTKRVVFHEITKPAVQAAFSNPRDIDMDLVDAQQARRVLDRLVGYNLSPILWEKVRSRLSAGRVQSVALKMVVDREREILAFNPVEYWTIDAEFTPQTNGSSFKARLVKINQADANLPDKHHSDALLDRLEKAQYQVDSLKYGERRRKPLAPFITSTLQQEASKRFGFTAKKTMALAQQLYEGIEIGKEGSTGLITYMRTDSPQVSQIALGEVRGYIKNKFGEKYLPESANIYRARSNNAQEAHEAIRPTDVLRTPEAMKDSLSKDLFRLYQLVWKRFVASQMEAALYKTTTVEVAGRNASDQYLFRASGSVIVFPGFLTVLEDVKEEDVNGDEPNIKLPEKLSEGDLLKLVQLLPEQHFTQPPPRFTEASLVQYLEECGIGRPSTYAPTISTILDRGYVSRDQKRLVPTDTGFIVNDLLASQFDDIVNTQFTAEMETDLDKIADGKADWTKVIAEFYRSFEPKLKAAQELLPVQKAEAEKIDRACPKCGGDLVIRYGRFGKFISCSNFPQCRHTEPWLDKIGVTCPEDGGDLVALRSRNGKTFYGCSNYPSCKFTSWRRPIAEKCPTCKGTLTILSKKEVQCLSCESRFDIEKIRDSASEE